MDIYHKDRLHRPLTAGLAGAALLAGLALMQTPAQGATPGTAPFVRQAPVVTRDGLAPPDSTVAASLPRYQQGRAAHFIDWMADGSLLIATRFGDTTQIHRVRSPLGEREQLSFAPQGVLAAAARPGSSDTLVYETPRADGRGTRLELLQLTQHSARALTDGQFLDRQPTWSPDGRELAFVSNRRGASTADVYVLDLATPGALPRLLAAGEGGAWHIDGWSPDGAHLLLGRVLAGSPSVAAWAAAGLVEPQQADRADTFEQIGQTAAPAAPETALYLADVAHGTIAPVSAPEAGANGAARRSRGAYPQAPTPLTAVAARFASDGVGLIVLTHELAASTQTALSREYLHLSYVDPASGRWRELTTPTAHDVRLFTESRDGHYLAYTLEDPSGSRLMLIDQQLRLEKTESGVPPGLIGSLAFDASSRRLAFTLQSPRAPADVYVLDAVAGQLTRWTESEVGVLDPASFVLPEQLQFPTWDRVAGQARQLSLAAYAADAGASSGSRPVVIWLCSGGDSLCRPRFAPFVQYLVTQLGCVVLAPEVRGSAGMGASLEQAGEGALTDDAVRDVGSLLVWIGLQPGLDHRRVAVLGEGYGSYLALQSLIRYPDRLLGAVAAFPPPLAGLSNALAIRRPLLLVQPLDNPAVPPYQAAQLREGLRAQGVLVHYVAVSGESGPFRHASVRATYQLAAASFLARLLRG